MRAGLADVQGMRMLRCLPGSALLLSSDLDDTLLSSSRDPALDAASTAFKALVERSRAAGVPFKLAINTGR